MLRFPKLTAMVETPTSRKILKSKIFRQLQDLNNYEKNGNNDTFEYARGQITPLRLIPDTFLLAQGMPCAYSQ